MARKPAQTATEQLVVRTYPKQQEFLDCPKRRRAFTAGRGAGKTRAGAIDLCLKAKPGGVYFVVAPCYDDQTEILTQHRGWQLFKNLLPTDAVATLQDGVRLEYHVPTEWHDYPYAGELICLNSQELDLAVTPDHRCYVKRRYADGWEMLAAKDIYGKHGVRFKRTAEWRDRPCSESEVRYYEYLGFWFAEGSAQTTGLRRSGRDRTGPYYQYHRDRVVVTQIKYPEYAAAVTEVAARWWRADGKWRREGKNFVITSREMASAFSQFGKSHTKRVPQWIKDAPVSLLRAFIKGYLLGDGHIKSGRHDQTNATTRSAQLADDLQEIAFKAGYACCRSRQPQSGMHYICIRGERKADPTTKCAYWSRRPYQGHVYCVRVPGGILYVRRNGKPVWCGNTYAMLDATMRTFIEVATQFGLWDHTKFWATKPPRAILKSGAEILFRSGDDPNALRGGDKAGAWLDEMQESDEEVYRVVEPCLRQWGQLGWMTCTFTPGSPDHWTSKVFINPVNPEDVGFFRASLKDNPFAPPGQYEELCRSWAASPLRRRRELEGECVYLEGAEWLPEYFDNIGFDRWPTDPEQGIRVIALDPSRGRGDKEGDYSAFVLVWFVSGGNGPTLYVDADMRNDRGDVEIAQTSVQLWQAFRPHYFVIESESGQNDHLIRDIHQIGDAMELPIAVASVDSKIYGLLGKGKIDKKTRIRSLSTYVSERWFRFKTGSPGAKILKEQMMAFPLGHDDGPDALSYAIATLRQVSEGRVLPPTTYGMTPMGQIVTPYSFAGGAA